MRNRQHPVERVALMFEAFGIDMIARWRLCKTGEEQIAAFEAARDEAKIYHRRLAMEFHPDRGGDEERLKEINAVWTMLRKVEMISRPQQPQRKSAMTVGEARARTQTSVFVGVTHDQPSTATRSATGDMFDTYSASHNAGTLSLDDFQQLLRNLGLG